MTLVELVVALSILGVIGVGLTAAVGAGLRTLGAGGVPDRLRGSADVVVLERAVSDDVARAGCVVTPAASLGACPVTMPAFCSAGAALCLAWPDAAGGCDAVRYRLEGAVLRRDSLTANGDVGSAELGREVGALGADAHPVAGWTDVVTVSVTAGPAGRAQQAAFSARPLVGEPRPC